MIDVLINATIKRTTYDQTCPLCRGSGNSNAATWDPTTGRTWRKCTHCRGYGRLLRNDIFERAVGWDLWLHEHRNVATRFLSWLIRPLCRVAVGRWDDV